MKDIPKPLVMGFALLVSACPGWSGTAQEREPVDVVMPLARLLDKESIKSKLLHRLVGYEVLLPEDYEASKQTYPVVYLLHGYGDNQTAWSSPEGQIQSYVDRYSSEIVPMIFVMPQAFDTYYVNRFDGTLPYMDFFTTELIPEIDAKFRTKKDRTQRAVMGYSMGGFGAIILPLLNPALFGTSVALSISMRTDDQYMVEQPQSEWDSQWGQNFGGIGLSGPARLTDYYKAHHPLHLLNQSDLSRYSGIRFFLDCGDDERQLGVPNGALHNLLLSNNIAHEYRVRNGAHNWKYWHGALHEALLYISDGFRGIGYNQEPTPANIGPLVSTNEYRLISMDGIRVGVFTPSSYDADSRHPVIFIIHDFSGYDRTTNALQLISLLHKNMANGTIPESLVVEIPQSDILNSNTFAGIVRNIDAVYKTVGNGEGKVLMGNGLGGATACAFMTDFTSVFNGCFLYDARLASNTVSPAFYYIDLPDKSANYAGNYELYLSLKKAGHRHEYRIRQGHSSPQSNLNGIEESMGYLNMALTADRKLEPKRF